MNEEELTLVIIKTITQFFDANQGVYTLFYEGQQPDQTGFDRYAELKYFGPFIEEDVDSNLHINIQVHIDCFAKSTNIYELPKMLNYFADLARNPIKFEDVELCLLNNGVRVMHRGQIQISSVYQKGIIEADYYAEVGRELLDE